MDGSLNEINVGLKMKNRVKAIFIELSPCTANYCISDDKTNIR